MRDEGLSRVVSEAHPREQLHPGIQALDDGVRESVGKCGSNAVDVVRYRRRQRLELWDATALRPAHHDVEQPLADVAAHLECEAKVLLDEPGAEERLVGLLDASEGLLLTRAEAGWVLEERIARPLDDRGIGSTTFARRVPEAPPHCVERVVRPFHDVKRVGADGCLRAPLRDGCAKSGGCVHADEFELLADVVAGSGEEREQGGLVLPGVRKEEPACVVVDDDGQVAVAAAVAHLVDADAANTFKAPMKRLGLLGHPFHDGDDAAPRNVEDLRHGGLVGSARQPGDEVLERSGEARARPCPRDMLDHHAVLRTPHSGCVGLDEGLHEAEVERTPPPPPAAGVVRRAPSSTARATAGVLGVVPDVEHDLRLLAPDVDNDGTLDTEQPGPYSVFAHFRIPTMCSWSFTSSPMSGVRTSHAFSTSTHGNVRRP